MRYPLLLILLFFVLLFSGFMLFEKTSKFIYQASLFTAVLQVVDDNYVEETDPEKLVRKAIDALVHQLDNYSSYYDSLETIQRNKSWRGELYSGIGMSLQKYGDQLLVIAVTENYPAFKAGILPGDRIDFIQTTETSKLSIDSCVSLLRGPAGSRLDITLTDVHGVNKLITLYRQQIMATDISATAMSDSVTGYLCIYQFLEGTFAHVKEALLLLKKKGCRNFIIDIRGNIGGLVQEAVDCNSLFLPKNALACKLKGRRLPQDYNYLTLYDPVDTNSRVVVLTDRQTISSGEIFCGAMQDADRAVIIGDTTAGKGVVQGTRFPGHGTSVYLTVAYYYTPSGRCIHKQVKHKTTGSFYTKNRRSFPANQGIVPDKLVIRPAFDPVVAQLNSQNFFFHFALAYRKGLKQAVSPTFNLPDQEWPKIKQLISTGYSLRDEVVENLQKAYNSALLAHADRSLLNRISKTLEEAKKNRLKTLDEHKAAILLESGREIIRQQHYTSGLLRYDITKDNAVKMALEVISGEQYQQILSKN